jgi:hypothetical protein
MTEEKVPGSKYVNVLADNNNNNNNNNVWDLEGDMNTSSRMSCHTSAHQVATLIGLVLSD